MECCKWTYPLAYWFPCTDSKAISPFCVAPGVPEVILKDIEVLVRTRIQTVEWWPFGGSNSSIFWFFFARLKPVAAALLKDSIRFILKFLNNCRLLFQDLTWSSADWFKADKRPIVRWEFKHSSVDWDLKDDQNTTGYKFRFWEKENYPVVVWVIPTKAQRIFHFPKNLLRLTAGLSASS